MHHSELRAQLERYHHEGYGWALGCCSRDPSEAESVLQTVYLKILEGKARFDGKSTFKTWLFAVIRKTAIDERRQRFFQRLWLADHGEVAAPTAVAERADDALYRSELQALFRAALAELPARQREALQLVFYHDLSIQEAAGVMGVSIGSARTHYERGKKRLRQWIEGSKIFDETE